MLFKKRIIVLPTCPGKMDTLEVLVIAQTEDRAREMCRALRAGDAELRPRPVADLEEAAELLESLPGRAALWCAGRLDSSLLRQVELFSARCPGVAMVVAADDMAEITIQSVLGAGAQECLGGSSTPEDMAGALRSAAARIQAIVRRDTEAQRYRSIVIRQTELICRFSADGELTFSNPAFRRYFNFSDLAGCNFFEQILASDREQAITQLGALELQHPLTRIEARVAPNHTGEIRLLRWSVHAIHDPDGGLREYQAVGQDITESKNLEDALQAAEVNLRQLIISNADGMVVTSEDGIVLFINPAAERLLGSASYGLLGRVFEYPLTPGQRQELELNSGGPDRVVAEMRVVETKWRGAKAFLATLRDISELKLLQEELRDMSLVDELTGIYNRRGFSTLAKQQLKTAQRMGRRVHLFFVDLDQLKKINDTMGHSQGDRAIRETALVLRATFRESDILGRWGGDEFSVLAMDTDEEGTQAVMKRLKRNLDDWNTDTARPYKISFSTGAATYNPERPETLENLIAQADRDMYESKHGRQSVKQPSRLARIGARD